MNIFEIVKQTVTTRQAAERYDIRVERNGMCRCPFHDDSTPSMKLDRRYYCFGCGATGDVIDFVSQLRGIGSKEAAFLLAQDFAIPYEDGTGKMSKPRQQNTDEQNYQYMERYLKAHQKDFMPEDTKAGMIQAFLDSFAGDTVCFKQLYKEALNHTFDEPKQWEIREINEIMNQCVTGWTYFSNPRSFAGYGRQKGWERKRAATGSGNSATKIPDGFVEITEQIEMPF